MNQSFESESDRLIISLDDEPLEIASMDVDPLNYSSTSETNDKATIDFDITSNVNNNVTSVGNKTKSDTDISNNGSKQETSTSTSKTSTDNLTPNKATPMRPSLPKSSEDMNNNDKTRKQPNENHLKNINFADEETEKLFKSLTYDRNLKLNPVLMTAENQKENKDFKEFDFAGTLAKARVSSSPSHLSSLKFSKD